MQKEKAKLIKNLIATKEIQSMSFDDFLSSQYTNDWIEEIIYLTGYNIVRTMNRGDEVYEVIAGVIEDDMSSKLLIKNGIVEGELSGYLPKVFNTLKLISNESNIIDYYPGNMRRSIFKQTLDNCELDENNLEIIRSRLAF